MRDFEQSRHKILDSYRKKQPFRVSKAKKYLINNEKKMSKWFWYEKFNPEYKLREVLDDEIIVEFDSGLYEKDLNKEWKDMSKQEQQGFRDLAWKGINFTAINLYKADIVFSIWEHKGKSPHLHIHNLPILDFEKDKRVLFKKLFIRKYVPLDYLPFVDYSLTGIHLVAIEWAQHWKGKYGIKELLYKFDPQEKSK